MSSVNTPEEAADRQHYKQDEQEVIVCASVLNTMLPEQTSKAADYSLDVVIFAAVRQKPEIAAETSAQRSTFPDL